MGAQTMNVRNLLPRAVSLSLVMVSLLSAVEAHRYKFAIIDSTPDKDVVFVREQRISSQSFLPTNSSIS